MLLTQPGLPSANDGLGAVGYLELGEDVRNVVANRLRVEVETGRDLGVAQALGDEVEDLALPRGQPGEARSERSLLNERR